MRRDLSTWTLAAVCHAQLIACGPATSTTEPADPAHSSKPVIPMAHTSTNTDELVDKLVRGAYGDFFNYTIREDAVAAVWAESDSLERLQAIVRDRAASMRARFLACEVLFDKHFVFVREIGPPAVAEIYAYALAHNLTGVANSWGLLYEHDDAGPVGIRFEMLGEPAVPALVGLLGDASRPLRYVGGEDATVGNAYGFRVKDFAAFYLGRIKRISVAFHQRPEDRDREISALIEMLRASR